MNISKNPLLLGLTLCSALIVTGCDKSDTTTETTDEVTETAEVDTTETVATGEVDTAEMENEEVAVVERTTATSTNDGIAKMLASTTTTAFFMPFTMSGELSTEQVDCLKSRDENLGVAETEGFLKKHLTDDEIAKIDEFYQTDTGKRLNKYSQEQMMIASGETVDNPVGEPTAEDMAEIEKYTQDPAFKKLAAIDETTGGNDLIEALKPVFNGEMERCKIDAQI